MVMPREANTIRGVDGGGFLLRAIALEQAFERLRVLSQQGKLDLHLYLDLPL